MISLSSPAQLSCGRGSRVTVPSKVAKQVAIEKRNPRKLRIKSYIRSKSNMKQREISSNYNENRSKSVREEGFRERVSPGFRERKDLRALDSPFFFFPQPPPGEGRNEGSSTSYRRSIAV